MIGSLGCNCQILAFFLFGTLPPLRGRVLAFGENKHGELGLGDFVSTATPRQSAAEATSSTPQAQTLKTTRAKEPEPNIQSLKEGQAAGHRFAKRG